MRLVGIAALLALVSVAPFARAQPSPPPPTPAELALSDVHVREARRLLGRDRVMDACEKFIEADKVYSRADVLVELADCYVRAGYPGTAYEILERARKLARETGRKDIEAIAESRLSKVAPRQGQVRITVADEANVPGLLLTLDGHRVEPEGTRARGRPVDPLLLTVGAHKLVITAPGYQTLTTEVLVAPNEERTVKIHHLERSTDAPPSSASKTVAAPMFNPLDPSRTPRAPPTPEAAAAAAATPKRAPVAGSINVRVFPVAGLYSTGTVAVAIPVTERVFITPSIAAGYLAPAGGGKTDVPYWGAVGLRYVFTPVWSASLVLEYAPEFSSDVNANVFASFSPAVKVSLSVTATRYTIGAFDKPLAEGHVLLDIPLRPVKWFLLEPHGMYFVYGRDLNEGTKSMTGLASGLAPYPIQAFVGVRLGYDTGRISPYMASRHFFYELNGYANTLGVGLRLALGADYVDTRVGLIASDAKGPFSNPQLEVIPVANIEAGWAF